MMIPFLVPPEREHRRGDPGVSRSVSPTAVTAGRVGYATEPDPTPRAGTVKLTKRGRDDPSMARCSSLFSRHTSPHPTGGMSAFSASGGEQRGAGGTPPESPQLDNAPGPTLSLRREKRTPVEQDNRTTAGLCVMFDKARAKMPARRNIDVTSGVFWAGGSSRGEGSVLDGIGRLLDGDRRSRSNR